MSNKNQSIDEQIINDPLFNEWQSYRNSCLSQNTYPKSFSEWKSTIFKGGVFIYFNDEDRISAGKRISKGYYWCELNQKREIIRTGGPFTERVDAASNVGKSDYYYYKQFYKYPEVSPFELDPICHRAWANGYEQEVLINTQDYEELNYPERTGYYWCIKGKLKEICHVNTAFNPPVIQFIMNVDIMNTVDCRWYGPLDEPNS